ncbi:hypothetical protein [Desulfotruncus alcoholivorax]|uniref:hypothetical protein n=1 Tax=Desulfotruncus alcoholivorax TaxID=265477 RepID=UPI00040BE461|nr:hypothetical protein [Desulfotruncus alcoholivorax]
MASTKKNRGFSDSEKALVAYLKEKLGERGAHKFPRDWHLKQLTTARHMLAGDKAPSVEEWKGCMDWAFKDNFWGDKVDHLARIEAFWPKYILKAGDSNGRSGIGNKGAPHRGSYGQGLSALYDDELPV